MTTAPRVCGACQVPERRWVENGRECVNLDPFTSYCIDCLVLSAKEARSTTPLFEGVQFDARAAAARNDQ